MNPYNFWQDAFDTYQSLSDWMKMLWLMILPRFISGVFRAMFALKEIKNGNEIDRRVSA